MTGTDPFSLKVNTDQLTWALRKVCRTDLRSPVVRLSFGSGQLTMVAGRASCSVPATGSWPCRIAVERSWATDTARFPVVDRVTDLEVCDGNLYTSGLPVPCRFVEEGEADEGTAQRRDDVAAAFQSWRDLAH